MIPASNHPLYPESDFTFAMSSLIILKDIESPLEKLMFRLKSSLKKFWL
jgi:hypothetical protein